LAESPLLTVIPAPRVWFHFCSRIFSPAATFTAKSSATARWVWNGYAVSPGFSWPASRIPSVTWVTP
jgi:hypothetical protein